MVIWEQQEKGWQTSELGGVSRENGGWFFWPATSGPTKFKEPIGPFKTAKDAKRKAEETA